MTKHSSLRRKLAIVSLVLSFFSLPALAEDVNITLNPGHNYISIPVGSSYDIKQLLSGLSATFKQAAYWNPATQRYLFWVGDPSFDQFTNFDYAKGYWVYLDSTQSFTLRLSGSPPASYTVSLKRGWNAIGCPKTASLPVEEALKPLVLGVDYESVWRFSSPNPPYYQVYSQTIKQFTTIKPGEGYWIKMLKDKDWQLNTPPILDPIGDKTVDENTLLSFTVTAKDPDGDKLTYSAANLPSGATFDTATGAFSWKPTYFQSGSYTVTFGVTDGRFSDARLVVINVNDVIPSEGVSTFPIEGAIFASWWNGEYRGFPAEQSLSNLAQTGANYVGVLATYYMDTTTQDGERSTSNRIYAHPQKTPSDEDIIQIIQKAKHLGRKVMLKLNVRVILSESPWSDAWAAYIKPSNEDEWFRSYTTFVEHYAQIAQDNGVEIFCFGTELHLMTVANWLNNHAAQWDSIIAAIKAKYSGKLTFSAHMDYEYKQISFWDKCDYLGIGPYFSLTEKDKLDNIVDSWRHSGLSLAGAVMKKIEKWQRQYNKPVLFTEIGYCSRNQAANEPWKGPTANSIENWQLQKKCYDALFLSLQGKPWFAGLFWWDWECNPQAGTSGISRKDFTPQNKDAEQSLKNFYFGINPQDVAAVKIVDGEDNDIADGAVINGRAHKNLYARAYDSAGRVLGYIPCQWQASGDAAEFIANNASGLALIRGIKDGIVTVSINDGNNHADSLSLKVVQKYLRVPQEYTNIQDAIDAGQEGDIVLVSPGAYSGLAKNNYYLLMKGGVSLISAQGPKNTIINSRLQFSYDANDNTSVQGFIINDTASLGGGSGIYVGKYYCSSGSPIIKNNIIKNNSNGGVDVVYSSPKIYNNIIDNNGGSGIYIDESGGGEAEIINNVIINNRTQGDGGGIFTQYCDVKIFNNIVTGNYARYGGGIKRWTVNYPGLEIGYNDVWNNATSTGREVDYGSPIGEGAISKDPLFTDADYRLSSLSPCKDAGHPDAQYNDVDGSRNDMGAYGGPEPIQP